MMKIKNLNYILLFLAISVLSACGSSNKVTSYKRTGSKVYSKSNTKHNSSTIKVNHKSTNVYHSEEKSYSSKDVSSVLKIAKSFLGTPYKYGGTNNTGFDCSGLVYVSFDQLGMKLPRNSSQQATQGKEIKISNVREGDLIFFNTSGNSISHVGIIEKIENNGEIRFIHSSTSKGVIISSLDEDYWKTRFVKAVRLL